MSRFLICKHIVYCFEDFQDPVKIFGRVQRRRSCPFWVETQLVLRPEILAVSNSVSTDLVEHSDFGAFELPQIFYDEDQLVSLEDEAPTMPNWQGAKEKIQWLIDKIDNQHAHGNMKFVAKSLEDVAGIIKLHDEIKELESSRTMPHTWTPRKFSSPMYYERYD
ncbi:hypothetical protein K3495_g13305 [Podosphaera aphanis]|nr:hypothetical protein K3495_g13305 [Podosphaera aphanis]